MDEVVAVIHQNPFGVGVSFDADGHVSKSFEGDLDFVANGLILPDVGTGADDEEVSEAGDFAKVEYLDILGLLLFGSSYGAQPKGYFCDGFVFRDRETSSCPYRTTIK